MYFNCQDKSLQLVKINRLDNKWYSLYLFFELGVYIGKKLLERYFTKEIIIGRFEKILFCALRGMEKFIAQNRKINLIATYLQ